MPLGTNEYQVVIEIFTVEDPAIRIQTEAKSFIAKQKWISPEVIYNDQKEELDENGVQWYSVVFVIGVDHITKDNKEWFADVQRLLDYARPLVNPDGPESTITLCFRSNPNMSETLDILNVPSTLENNEEVIQNLVLVHKRESLLPSQFLLQNKRTRIVLPLLTLAGCILWPINNFPCRLLLIMSMVCLAMSMYLAWGKFFKRHGRIAAGIVAVILVICGYMSFGQHLADESTVLELRQLYFNELRRYEGTRYVWGGENMLGMDCSGLPRKALRNALLKSAFFNGNGKYLRHAVKNWWMDASAAALASGYQHYLTSLEIEGTVAEAPEETLSPGVLAITTDGRHVMVFLEKDTWISADPMQGKVVIERPSISHNPWFDARVKFYSWSVLIPYHDF